MRNNGLAYLFVSSREKMSELKNKVVKEIKKGEHVHVHNVKTKKW